jgi:hypothetical protein
MGYDKPLSLIALLPILQTWATTKIQREEVHSRPLECVGPAWEARVEGP